MSLKLKYIYISLDLPFI